MRYVVKDTEQLVGKIAQEIKDAVDRFMEGNDAAGL